MTLSFNSASSNLGKVSNIHLNRIEALADNRPIEINPYYLRAEKGKSISNAFVKYIDSLQLCLNKDSKSNKKHFEITKDYFHRAHTTRKHLLDLIKDDRNIRFSGKDRDNLISKGYLEKSTFDFNLNDLTYYEASLIFAEAKIECKNFETELMILIGSSIDISKCFFRRLKVFVYANANIVMVGSNYRAEVILSGGEDLRIFEVIVNGKSLPMDKGRGIYITKPEKPGKYRWGGYIRIKSFDGYNEFPFEAEYIAGNCY